MWPSALPTPARHRRPLVRPRLPHLALGVGSSASALQVGAGACMASVVQRCPERRKRSIASFKVQFGCPPRWRLTSKTTHRAACNRESFSAPRSCQSGLWHLVSADGTCDRNFLLVGMRGLQRRLSICCAVSIWCKVVRRSIKMTSSASWAIWAEPILRQGAISSRSTRQANAKRHDQPGQKAFEARQSMSRLGPQLLPLEWNGGKGWLLTGRQHLECLG